MFIEERYPDPAPHREGAFSQLAGCDTNQLSTQAGVPRDTVEASSHFDRIALRTSGWLRHS